jgi:hypothetical protein
LRFAAQDVELAIHCAPDPAAVQPFDRHPAVSLRESGVTEVLPRLPA